MNLVLLENAIRARVVQSLATASVTVQGVWSEIAPPGKELKRGNTPTVVFTLLSGTDDDTFDDNGGLVTYRVWISDHITNGTTAAKNAYAAIYGNGTPTNAETAGHTMGLHRWKATGVTDLAISQARRVRFGHPHEGEALRYFMDFEIYAEDA